GSSSSPLNVSVSNLTAGSVDVLYLKNASALNIVGDVTASGAISLSTNTLINAFVITAGDTLDVTSSAGKSLTISGGGTLAATSGINLTATNSNSVHPSLIFSGDQTFNGITNLNASAVGQSIII